MEREGLPDRSPHIPETSRKDGKNANNQHLHPNSGKLPKFVNNSLSSYNRIEKKKMNIK